MSFPDKDVQLAFEDAMRGGHVLVCFAPGGGSPFEFMRSRLMNSDLNLSEWRPNRSTAQLLHLPSGGRLRLLVCDEHWRLESVHGLEFTRALVQEGIDQQVLLELSTRVRVRT